MTKTSFRRAGVVFVCLGLGSAGCGSKGESPQAKQESAAAANAGVPDSDATTPAGLNLHQSFADATTQVPPDNAGRPPDTTITGKSVGKLYMQVVANWDNVKFVTPDGKKLAYRAVLETELGNITIQLLPEIAPNHVRSFVGLARAGYYDGLFFDRLVRQMVEDQPETKMEYVEAGCPLGTGQVDQGSIGYWLKPECNAEITHEPGVVGAVHGAEEDVSGCKFYINICKAPIMDGNFTVFGKVVEGFDVAAKIMNAPVRLNDAEYPDGDRPEKPVAIRKVTVLVDGE